MGGGHAMGDNPRSVLEFEIEDLVNEKSGKKETEISVIGDNIIFKAITEANSASIMILVVLSIIFVITILIIIYRNLFDMGMSLISLGMGIVWMYGAGAVLQFTFNPITTMVPILIV